MKLYVFSGPNGSGKSTLINSYIIEHGLNNVEYICPDIYASTIYKDIIDIKERYIAAMDFAEYKRIRLLKEKKPMIVETVLSRTDKIEFIENARSQGYHIISVFVGTESPEINIERVKNRVNEGGHDVPVEKIKERYVKSMNNLPLLINVSDEIYIYDNSKSPRLIVTVVNRIKHKVKDLPQWAKNI